MPATRLRSMDWQRSLAQVHERGGSLDIAVANHRQDHLQEGVNVLWRVRLIDFNDDELVVERPSTLGAAIGLEAGIELIVVFAIGQNRWMFRTKNLGADHREEGGGRSGARPVDVLRLAFPSVVERCQRRSAYRVSTAALSLPQVDVWPLLDPKTVVLAERANELSVETGGESNAAEFQLPEVGPRFSARLLNLGGGGVGLLVPCDQGQPLLRNKLFWLRIALPPTLTTPICATGKVVHTHMQATQDYYAGMSFDFTFNPGHQKFMVEQIGRYVASVQRDQLMRRSAG